MGATVQLERYTGPTGAVITNLTSVGNTVGNTQDIHQTNVVTSLFPLPIPPVVSTIRGFWVVTGINATVAPTTTLNNLRWHLDGGNSSGSGVGLAAGNAPTYNQATGTVGSNGNNMSGYGGILNFQANAFTYTSGSPMNVTGSSGAATGRFGNYVIFQWSCDNTSPPGPTATETVTWLYDET